jgi:hypothetical protein
MAVANAAVAAAIHVEVKLLLLLLLLLLQLQPPWHSAVMTDSCELMFLASVRCSTALLLLERAGE